MLRNIQNIVSAAWDNFAVRIIVIGGAIAALPVALLSSIASALS